MRVRSMRARSSIPYLDQQGAQHWSAIATKLVPVDATDLVTQEDHTVLFAETRPCSLDGLPIPDLDIREARYEREATGETRNETSTSKAYARRSRLSREIFLSSLSTDPTNVR
ncbi:hypothetical protein D3C87_1392510 [compost metagenome]